MNSLLPDPQKPERFSETFQVSKFLNTKRKIVFFIAVLILTILLMIFFKDVVREVIAIPISYVFWRTNLLFRIVPQFPLWTLFLVFACLILVKSLLRPQKSKQKKYTPVRQYPSRVEELTRLLHFAKKWNYSRWNLAHYLAELSSEILAFQARCPLEQIRERLRDGNMGAGKDIQAYFQAAMTKGATRQPGFFSTLKQQLRPQKQSTPLDLDLEIIISFLENRLEGHYDDRNQ